MASLRVFFAQPVDCVPFDTIRKNVERLEKLTEGWPVEIVAPYLSEESACSGAVPDRESAREMVKKDYAALETCHMLVVDLSRDDRQIVGMFFEMAYAGLAGKVIVAYTGKSSISQRTFIVAHADHICCSWAQVGEYIKKYIDSSSQ